MTHVSPHTAHGHEHDADGQAELLDLDAEVLAEHNSAIAAGLPVRTTVRHIVDLGCGTGAGALTLLKHFPQARVTAVDASTGHLRRLLDKAEAEGLADRVHTVRADLDTAWPELGAPELVWASASMHHMADPDRTLRRIHDTLAPGGLLALVELAGFPRFLPEDAPADRPGLEERCHAALDHHHAERLPHRGADWGPKLTAAGFTVESERTVTVDLGPSRSDAVGRYALGSLRRMRGGVAATATALTAEDLAALDRLLDTDSAHSILRRDDLTVRTERMVWAARRGRTPRDPRERH
ncbi:SAM-dependent methyltransferase [Streptomyces aurantiacus]|uniref:class I SAM-dependent methyltransferase n=1 Tax=Streptomyces aurantiacus TaxID=47760 RepID=UPI00278F68FD|nr:class I SAM-dependent methyltransferase [Streptomyces aurantiacus]MDQ0772204.1 SAM-dependent methyltransferase [Streptomyces aurantiacus]